MFDSPLDRLTGPQLAALIAANHAQLVEHETRVLVLACAWADLHDADPDQPYSPLVERACQWGGVGTPEVSEFCAVEFGTMQGVGYVTARAMIADALDLRHRLPRLWAQVQAGQVRAWQARKVAEATRALSWEACAEVDAAISGFVGMLTWTRFQKVLSAAIIDADPVAAAERTERARTQRDVWVSGSDDGLKLLIGRAAAGDIIWFMATVNRIADILATDGDTDPVGARRSKAIGILAHPARALQLLIDHQHDADDPTQPVEPDRRYDDEPDARDTEQAHSRGNHAEAEPRADAAAEPEADAAAEPQADAATEPQAERAVGADQANKVDERVNVETVEPSADGAAEWSAGPQADRADGADEADRADERANVETVEPSDDGAAEWSVEQTADPRGRGAMVPPVKRPSGSQADAPAGSLVDAPAGSQVDTPAGTPVDTPAECPVDASPVDEVCRSSLDLSPRPGGRLVSRPRVTLVFHLSDAAVRDGHGTVRPEHGDPITLDQLHLFLADTGCQVTVRPVIDPADTAPVDGYEIPHRVRAAVRLRHPGEVFPYGSSTSAHQDLDHTIPYLPMSRGGPPGQTGINTLGPLSRAAHRATTLGRWKRRQPNPGTFIWKSPNGWVHLVTNKGTLDLGNTTYAQTIWRAAKATEHCPSSGQ